MWSNLAAAGTSLAELGPGEANLAENLVGGETKANLAENLVSGETKPRGRRLREIRL